MTTGLLVYRPAVAAVQPSPPAYSLQPPACHLPKRSQMARGRGPRGMRSTNIETRNKHETRMIETDHSAPNKAKFDEEIFKMRIGRVRRRGVFEKAKPIGWGGDCVVKGCK